MRHACEAAAAALRREHDQAALHKHAGAQGQRGRQRSLRCCGKRGRPRRTCLDRQEAGAIIGPCDPDVVAARIKCADRCPEGWDLDLSLIRDDLAEADVAAFFDALGPTWRLTASQRSRLTPAVRRRWTKAGHRMGWPGSLGRTRTASGNLRGAGRPGSPRRPASTRPGRRGAANATIARALSASTAPRPCPRCRPGCGPGQLDPATQGHT